MSAVRTAAPTPRDGPLRLIGRLDRSFVFDVGLGLTAIAIAIALNLVR
ncbi:MAG TPA: hypothetical protein VF802_02565 [Candidatus Limnocylindrales bacterium]